MKQSNQQRPAAGFTLVEMLTVIAIIAILVGLLFPAVQTALRKAETSKAQVAVSGLTTAFKAYYTEYGRWPVTDTATVNYTGSVNASMVSLLRGVNVTSSAGGTATYAGNPRNIQFFEIGAKDTNSAGFVDPWGAAYLFALDTTYTNQVTIPVVVGAGAIVWSNGRDGKFGTTDDVKSW